MTNKEYKVATVDDLADGEMKMVKAGETEVLLVRRNGEFVALGAHCPHYGAPLADGLLHGDRIVCPWHHACFHAGSGDLLEPPARDALPRFDVRIEGSEIFVRIPDNPSGSRLPEMVTADPDRDSRTFLIIGAGAAADAAAQAMRENGFRGRIIMTTPEDRLPYDRPNLSKDYLQGSAEAEWMPLRSADFYREHGIEVQRGRRVTALNVRGKTVTFKDGGTLAWDKILLASGGVPRALDLPGAGLANLFTLRSFVDCDRLIEAAGSARRVVIIGAGFIGMEAAHSLTERGLSVTVVGRESVPLEKVFGREIGAFFQRLHQEAGVRFRLGARVVRYEGPNRVSGVILDDGDRLPADLVLVAVGIRPATEYAADLPRHADGGIQVDEYLRASEGVYAAGDIARFPDWRTSDRVRIEHWRTAGQLGRLAGQNMTGRKEPFRSVPFFWTSQVGLSFQYVGHTDEWDDIIIDGDLDSREFVAYFVTGDQVPAVAGNFRDRQLAAAEELIREGRMPTPAELRAGSVDLVARLQEG